MLGMVGFLWWTIAFFFPSYSFFLLSRGSHGLAMRSHEGLVSLVPLAMYAHV